MRKTGILLALLMTFSMAAGVLAADDVTPVRVGAMSGPTAMGMVQLMDASSRGETKNTYEFADLMTEASAFVAPLTKGELDIAALPANLASVIYNRTEGGITVLAVNVLGVLNIVERGETVQALTDLAGKTIYATGQGATPEAALRYLLTENGIDPDTDLDIHWCADTTEALAYITGDSAAIAMLPQPFVTSAKAKVEDLRVAFSLSDEWDKLDNGSMLITGVVAARRAFIDEHPEEVADFMEEYAASVAFTEENLDEAAALVASFGIVPAPALAKAALPNCSITFLAGEEMKEALSGYLEVLYDSNPAMVGGALPGDDFYY